VFYVVVYCGGTCSGSIDDCGFFLAIGWLIFVIGVLVVERGEIRLPRWRSQRRRRKMLTKTVVNDAREYGDKKMLSLRDEVAAIFSLRGAGVWRLPR
jgi:hypothetical protein